MDMFKAHEIRDSIHEMTVNQIKREIARLERKYDSLLGENWTHHDMPENDDKPKLIELYHALNIKA